MVDLRLVRNPLGRGESKTLKLALIWVVPSVREAGEEERVVILGMSRKEYEVLDGAKFLPTLSEL